MTTLEKDEIKQVIREVVREDKSFFKELLQEVLAETVEQEKTTEHDQSRAERIDAIIRKDFERYKNVFKALA